MKETNASGDDRTAFDLLTPEEMLWVNQGCDEFERRWRQGTPLLTSFLKEIDASKSQSMLAALSFELIAIDIQHRHRLGLECSLKLYESQFNHLTPQELSTIYESVVGSSQLNDDRGPLQLGQQLGDYVIKERIGSGGMGAVYRAEHRLMGRHVAIKVLSGRASQDLNSQRRFLREVRAFAKLSHSNIVSAFDARLEGELLYLVTEWVQGEDLAQRVARTGPLDCREALGIALQAARGLQYAHAQGIVHRDVKPSNLILDQHGTVKVLDLGLSRLLLEDNEISSEALTQSMHLLGTVAYMSPEQARSPLSSDQRSDIYSLGCTLFFLMTGKPPYAGTTAIDVLFSHAGDPLPEVLTECKTADVPTSNLVHSMLAKEPSQRPMSMSDVATQIEIILIANEESNRDSSGSKLAKKSLAKAGSHRFSKRIAFAAISIFLAVIIIPWLGGYDLRDVWRSVSTNSSNIEVNAGIRLNGVSSYGEIIDFDVPLPDTVQIEVSFTAEPGDGPANLITWTGNRIFGLFIDQNNCWGVSFADGRDSYVSISNEKTKIGRQQLIAARYYQGKVQLVIDGRPVPTTPRDYSMIATTQKFCFGGLPSGLLPLDVGTRYISGKLHRIRVSTGDLPNTASIASQLVNHPGSTLVLLQFSELAGKYVVDESSRKWLVQLNNMPDVNSPQ